MLRVRRGYLLVAGLCLLPAAGTFHLRLVKSAPLHDEVVTAATREIRLWFSEKPEVAVSTITLLRSDSSAVPIGKVSGTGDSLAVKAAIPEALPVGHYIVKWRAMAGDGHAVRGSFTFQQTK